ncbi:YqhG family protein [Metabacillus fastidiosus]|uniref:YqhG family protein n=1 Tax=Metabacillus fastidiosus TaxID=1458 RepID=UPI003D26799E
MQLAEIHTFLENFFETNQCDIIENNSHYLTVQLTVEMDKELMNRPFYWHYLEKTNGTPKPAQLTFITNQQEAAKDIKGEFIHFGSPRLHQIFQTAKKLGSSIRLYEQSETVMANSIPLHPWLGVNFIVSYQCDMKKDRIFSIGLHLINGVIIEDFQQKIEKLKLTPKIPDFSFTMSPLIKTQSGLNRIQTFLKQIIEKENHQWAADAKKRWDADLALLNHFYEDLEEKPDCYYLEKAALQDLYEPKINVTIQNGGVFYLSPMTTF